MITEEFLKKIVIPGGAGLVGQNLVLVLKANGYQNITVIDKHRTNLAILRSLHPEITAIDADLSHNGVWTSYLKSADVVVMLQAQIGGNYLDEFVRNNVNSTNNILSLIRQSKKIIRLVHISSSVVQSGADDFYTKTKKEQEKLVLNSGLICPILRPTLMFGFFDRKHLGWLSRFMHLVPVFPIPGDGKYLRQPLYVQDFCQIILACIKDVRINEVFNISGLEHIYYIDIIRHIKRVKNLKIWIVTIPYLLFYFLLWLWSKFDRDPPFTTQQLAALSARDEFEVIDWPTIFNVKPTPFELAIQETLTSPKYSNIKLEF
jgi:nucleoside-diphosphate-sugar epimerase